MSKRDYYEILGVSRDADEREFKRAYRKRAMAFHPDRNPGDAAAEARFKEAAEAYEVLSDPERRRIYDRFGHDGLDQSRYSTGAGFSSVEDIFGQFSDIFGDVFGFAGTRKKGPKRGRDIRHELELEFEEAIFGASKSFALTREVTCSHCDGHGTADATPAPQCTHCGGEGQVTHTQGFFTLSSTCPKCDGRGVLITDPCKKCDGAGVFRQRRDLNVKIPAGVDEGTRLRVRGEGEPGVHGGPAGDVLVFLSVRPSEDFERDGLDLHHTTTISFVQAALGTTVTIPTLDAPRTIEIAAGTQPDDVVVLEDCGVTHVGGRHVGNLNIHVKVGIPTTLDARQRELLEEFARCSGMDLSYDDPSPAVSAAEGLEIQSGTGE